MGCAQSSSQVEVVAAEPTPHEKLLARNRALAERKERDNMPVFVQVDPRGSPAWSEDSPGSSNAAAAGSPGGGSLGGSPGSVGSARRPISRPASLASGGPDSPVVPSWRTGPDADMVYKAGTLSLYTQDTGTWESCYFELAQWSADGRFCLRYKRFRGDERFRQCWRLGGATEVRRGAQRSTLSMRERMSEGCPSGVMTVTALDPRDQGGQSLATTGDGEASLDELLVGTRYELTIGEWADRIEELVPSASAAAAAAAADGADEARPASPSAAAPSNASSSPGARPEDSWRTRVAMEAPSPAGAAQSSTPAHVAARSNADSVTVEDLSLRSPTSPIRAYISGDSPAVMPSPPIPAPPPPAPPSGGIDDGGIAMRSGVAARRRAMGGGLDPEREWNPRDRNFDPFADKVSQTNASLGECTSLLRCLSACLPVYLLVSCACAARVLHQLQRGMRGVVSMLYLQRPTY
jgi:hypothetical protein